MNNRISTLSEFVSFMRKHNDKELDIRNYGLPTSKHKHLGAIYANGGLLAVISKGLWYEYKKHIRKIINRNNQEYWRV